MPAAGRGARFGSSMPKQYLEVAGQTLIEHSLRALLGHPGVDGVMVALSPDDPFWAGWREMAGKPIYTCRGGAERADSVLAALQALPATVSEDQWVLVHDAARPCLRGVDLSRRWRSARRIRSARSWPRRYATRSSARTTNCAAA